MEYTEKQQTTLRLIMKCQEVLAKTKDSGVYKAYLVLLKYLLEQFDGLLNPEEKKKSGEYKILFSTDNGMSFYELFCLELADFEKGWRPF